MKIIIWIKLRSSWLTTSSSMIKQSHQPNIFTPDLKQNGKNTANTIISLGSEFSKDILARILSSVRISDTWKRSPPILGLGSESNTEDKVKSAKRDYKCPHSSFLFRQESEFVLPPSLFIFLTVFDFLQILRCHIVVCKV